MDVPQKVWLTSDKILICKCPLLRINFSKAICIELPDKAGEVIVLEEPRQQIP